MGTTLAPKGDLEVVNEVVDLRVGVDIRIVAVMDVAAMQGVGRECPSWKTSERRSYSGKTAHSHKR